MSAGGAVKKKRESFDFPLLGYSCQDFGLWHGVSVRRISMRGRALRRREKKHTLLGLKMCTCELSLSHADPDVNRGPLMSKEVDKQAFIAPPHHPTPTPFYLGLSSANGLYSINQLVCNFEGQLSSDGSLVFSASSFLFLSRWFEDLGVSLEEQRCGVTINPLRGSYIQN